MEREQEDMQFLGLFGIYLESFKIIFKFKKTFGKITLALILPLSFLFLAHIEVSDLLHSKIIHTEDHMHRVREGMSRYAELSDNLTSEQAMLGLVKIVYFTFYLIFSLLSISAVVYTVASVYTGRDVTFGKVMGVVPKVWKRLMVTFLCACLAIFLYQMVLFVTLIFWFVTIRHVYILGALFSLAILISYVVGFVYLALVWELANVVSVLEDVKGFEAMTKSRNLINGKMGIAMVIFFKLYLAKFLIMLLFKLIVANNRSPFGVVGKLGFGLLCLFMLLTLFLFGLVVQTLIYFVCKSYHHENINKLSLSDHLAVYDHGEYLLLKALDIQLEQVDV